MKSFNIHWLPKKKFCLRKIGFWAFLLLIGGCSFFSSFPRRQRIEILPCQFRYVNLQWVATIGSPGNQAGQLLNPLGISTDLEGNIYIADTGNDRIQKFSSEGKYLKQTGGFGWDNGQFNRPTDILVNKNFNILVVDSRNQRIQQFDQRLNFIRAYYLKDSLLTQTQFGNIYAIEVGPNGDIFITDPENELIYQLTLFGTFRQSFAYFGYGPGEVQQPAGLSFSPQGELYVCSQAEQRIVIFDLFGNFLGDFGQQVLTSPLGIVVDRWGYCFVSDSKKQKILIFNPRGQLVGTFGRPGNGPGEFNKPADLALTENENYLLVCDSGNGRLQKLLINRITP